MYSVLLLEIIYVICIFSIIAVLSFIKRYFAGGVCRCNKRLNKLVVIITGANSGIGKALAIELAARDATIILACRNIFAANTVREFLQQKYPNINVFVKKLDLNNFANINSFALEISSEFKEIYALVNNAGVFYHSLQKTTDGFDVTFQTNYLGPFLLSHLLRPVLKQTEHPRIINVCSEAHRQINDIVDLNNYTVNLQGFSDKIKLYGATKLSLLLFTRRFAQLAINEKVLVNAVNPGNVETSIYRNFPLLSNRFLYGLQWGIRLLVVKTPHEGAQTLLHAILTDSNHSGKYLSDCKIVIPNLLSCDNELLKNYYKATLKVFKDYQL